MPFEPQIHHRHSIRLKGYDYSLAGMYFVTIATYQRTVLFGEVSGNEVVLNPDGNIVQSVWVELPQHYMNIELGEYCIMPNHFHGIIGLVDLAEAGSSIDVGAGFKPAPTNRTPAKIHGLGEIVRGFKTFSARKINDLHRTPGNPVWQRNYFEHIIRNETELEKIQTYIADNPRRWLEDEEFTETRR